MTLSPTRGLCAQGTPEISRLVDGALEGAFRLDLDKPRDQKTFLDVFLNMCTRLAEAVPPPPAPPAPAAEGQSSEASSLPVSTNGVALSEEASAKDLPSVMPTVSA
jgi:hypothetical protein